MRHLKLFKTILVFCMGAALAAWPCFAADELPHPDTYVPDPFECKDIKKLLDDPTDVTVARPYKTVLPPEIWNLLVIDDVEEAKKLNEEVVGFRSPDVVGKIVPEIKPGKYTYEDLEKSPGLKELFPPEYVMHIKPGGPPLVGNIAEFEIIPTRQFYLFPRALKMTKENLGKTKLDKDGYIVPRSWQGGIPFPKPSGKFKAQQVFYNFERRVASWDGCFRLAGENGNFDRNFNRELHSMLIADFITLQGRALLPPYGWFDERAEKNAEWSAFGTVSLSPRETKGTCVLQYKYDNPYKMDPWMVYVPSLRRIRKMAATDTQDPQGMMAYDDRSHLAQKITPKKFPYTFEIIEEREYLYPVNWDNGAMWVDSKNGLQVNGVQFMRRPCYVLQMNQQDPNYIYSKRVIYIDRENFYCPFSANYDQKGRLWRSQIYHPTFHPEIGLIQPYGGFSCQWDHLEEHSGYQMQLGLPAPFGRRDFKIQTMIKRGK